MADPRRPQRSAAGTIAVHIEPLPGVSGQRLRKAMRAAGVTNVEELVPGILSAEMPAEKIRELDGIAGVEIMQPKRMR